MITEAFVSAAELMSQVLGAADYPFAVMPHPISSASEENLAAAARDVATRCGELLTAPADGRR